MAEEFLINDKSILPEHFGMIIEIKELIDSGCKISDACKKVGLSRSTFYKYKDFVFLSDGFNKKKANMLVRIKEKGSLITVLEFFEERNIQTINVHKEKLVNNIQQVFLTLSVSDLAIDFSEIAKELKKLENIKEVVLLGSE